MTKKRVYNVLSALRAWKPYTNTKDSGIEWLDQIPAHWEIRRLRHCAALNPSKCEVATSPRETETSFLPMTKVSETGELALDETREIGEVFEGYTYFRNNDILLAKITPCFENGKAAVAKNLVGGRGFGSTEFHVLRPRGTTDRCFLYYVVFSDPLRRIGTTHMIGAAGQKRVAEQFVLDWVQPFPELSEQQAIADFLDRETAKIDALVEKKERLIELLQEKRTALITHAVTKGLDPNVPMKDSGIEWLGQIPVHWDESELKFALGEPITDGPHETPEFLDEGIPFLSAESVKNDRLDFERKRGFISQEDHVRFSRKYSPRRGDVYMVKSGATTGNVARVETDEVFDIWSPLAAMRPDMANLTTDFLFYFLKSKACMKNVELNWSFGTQQNIGMGVISNLRLVLPPIGEQRIITEHLDRETAKLDALISKIQEAIERLKEYRTALISAAVTGKIDVRSEVRAESAEEA